MKAVVVSLAWVLLAAMAEGANFVGQITKVAIKTFTVKGGEQTKEFLVAEQTVFQKGSKRVSFRELKVGQEVTVVFTEDRRWPSKCGLPPKGRKSATTPGSDGKASPIADALSQP